MTYSMTMTAKAFGKINMPRVTQLVNKTNQFNLTTRRYGEAKPVAMKKPAAAATPASRWTLNLRDYTHRQTHISIAVQSMSMTRTGS